MFRCPTKVVRMLLYVADACSRGAPHSSRSIRSIQTAEAGTVKRERHGTNEEGGAGARREIAQPWLLALFSGGAVISRCRARWHLLLVLVAPKPPRVASFVPPKGRRAEFALVGTTMFASGA